MKEVLTESFALVNLPFTVLVLLVMSYWLLVIVGFLGMESLDMDTDVGGGDFDLDADADVDVGGDVDVDADADVDVDAGADGHADVDAGEGCLLGGFSAMLSFVNAGKLPLAVILSFFFVFLWVGMLTANHYLNEGGSLLVALGLFVGLYIVCILATKVVTTPLAGVFKKLNEAEAVDQDAVGMVGTLVTSLEGTLLGQVEIETGGAPHRINVRSMDGERIEKGSRVVVLRHDTTKNLYYVRPSA